MTEQVSRRRQALAILALVCLAGLVAVLVVFLFRNFVYVVVGLVGLSVAAVGGWWLVTERMARRAIGAVIFAVGIVVIVGSIVRAVEGADQIILRLAIVCVLIAIATVAAHAAMRPEKPHIDRVESARRATPPEHPVLLCNPWSGGGKVEQFGLVDLATDLGVETVMLAEGLDLEELARDAIARGADCLGMAGGDGSQALVASIAIEHDLPFVCVSAGTRNHFALDLGLNRDDPRESMYAFRDAIERRIDYATVGDRLFVNNVSLGVYATIVQEDSYRDAKADTAKTLLPEMLGRQSEPFDLQFTRPDGSEVDGAFLIMISNNPYVTGSSPDAFQRRSIDIGTLGVFAVSAPTGREATRLLTLSAVGQRNRSPYWDEFATDEFEVRSHSGTAFAGIDGEALDLPTPLRFRIHPHGLRLYVPEGNLEAAEQRRARDAKVADLFSVAARGRPSHSEAV